MRKSSLIILITLAISCVSALGFHIRPVSAIIWIEGHITSNTTWVYIPNETYRVINDTYVDSGVTLTILPGVHVQFADGFSLIVQGSLNATGTNSDPILFTSGRASPSSGVWNTVKFEGDSSESFLLEYADVEFAVNGITIESLGYSRIARNTIANCSQSGILINGVSNLTIEENTLEQNGIGITTDAQAHAGIMVKGNNVSSNTGHGIYLSSTSNNPISDVTFLSNTVTSNTGNGFYWGKGIYVSSNYGSISNLGFLSNNVSSNAADGIEVITYGSISHLAFSSNTVTSNKGYGIFLWVHQSSSSISDLAFLSNTVTSNTRNGGIFLQTDYGSVANVSFSSNTVSSNAGNGIEVYGYGSISHLAFSSNTVSSNNGNGITTGNGIYLHDSYGFISDVNFLSNTVTSNTGSGIYANSDRVFGVAFSSDTVSSNTREGIFLLGFHEPSVVFDITATNCKVASNKHSGIYVQRLRLNATENSICYNPIGILFEGTTGNKAFQNDIYSNTGFGIEVTEGATVNAEYDYWGDPTGPYNLSANPEGKGNPVNGNGADLDFIPFRELPWDGINKPPVAALSTDKKTVSIFETVTFDSTNSTDDGRIDYYFFDFGDGTNRTWITEPIVTHKYIVEGTYYATVTVKDDCGVTSNNSQLIEVKISVIPEFSSLLLLPLFMIAVLPAVIVYRQKRNRTKTRASLLHFCPVLSMELFIKYVFFW